MKVRVTRWLRGLVVIMVVAGLVIPMAKIDTGDPPGPDPLDLLKMLKGNNGPSVQDNYPETAIINPDLDGYFIQNKGQLSDGGVLFYAPGHPLMVYLGVNWIAYRLSGEDGTEAVVKVAFEGGNEGRPIGVHPLTHSTNYFIGSDPKGWVTEINSYNEVKYTGIWEGVDIRFYFSEDCFKYDLICHPGSSISDVIFTYQGVEGLSIDPLSGDLVIRTTSGALSDMSPVAFQYDEGGRVNVSARFESLDVNSVGFETDAFDPSIELIIDPGLEFSTYFGGRLGDGASYNKHVALTDDGGIVLGGYTGSDDLPITTGAYCTTINGSQDIFVAKFNHNLSELEFSTYIGGSGNDATIAISLTSNGTILVAGQTSSTDFPTTKGAYDSDRGGPFDGFLLGLSSDGSNLHFGTYIGGSERDNIWDVIADGDDIIYALVPTESDDFPTTPNAFCTTLAGSNDLVVLKFSSANQSLVYSTYVGGSNSESVFGMMLASNGTVIVVGSTESPDFPTTVDAYDPTYNGGLGDAYIIRLNTEGSALEFSTFLGGSGYDIMKGIVLDPAEGIWLIGATDSNDLPVTADAYQDKYGGGVPWPNGFGDAMIASLSSNGSSLEYLSYLGGKNNEWGNDIVMTPSGEIIVMGATTSNDFLFPTSAYDRTYDKTGGEPFVAWLKPGDDLLINGTYLGSTVNDLVGNMEMTQDGTIVIVGHSWGTDFPTTADAFQPKSGGGVDVFVAGLSMGRTPRDPPSVPLNLTAVASDGWVNLSWELPVQDGHWPIEGYHLYRGTQSDNLTMCSQVPLATKFHNSGVENGVTYYYKVSSFNTIGEGPSTEVISATPYGSPSSPANFTSTPGCGTVLLEWDPPWDDGGLPIEGYRLSKGESIDNLNLLATLGLNHSYLDVGLETGKTYYYSIRAYHVLGNGTPSPVLSVKTLGLPTEPTDFAVIAGDGSIIISWAPPMNLGGTELSAYRLYRGYYEDGLEHLVRLSPNAISYADTNLAIGVTYYYAVVAENPVGIGPMTSVLYLTLTGPPGICPDVDVTSGDGWVNVSWRPPEDIGGTPVLGFFVYRSIDNAPYVQLGDVRDALWFNDTTVVNGETYYYRISAFNAKGEGIKSTAVMATPFGLPTPPTSITIREGDGWLEIGWDPPSDTKGSPLVGYNLYRGPSPDDLTLITNLGSRETSHMDPDRTVGVTYHYAMTSITGVGEGPLSGVISGTPFGIPWEPTEVVALGAVGSILVSWSPPLEDGGRPVSGYVLYRGLDPGSLDLRLEVGALTSYEDTGVEAGTIYHFSVTALNVAGEGARSGAVMATPELPVFPPGPPLTLTGEAVDGSVLLSWSPPLDNGGADVTDYTILRGPTASELLEIAQLGNVLTFIDENLVEGRTYHYAVAAVNVAGRGEMSEIITINIKAEQASTPEGGVPFWLVLVGIGLITILSLGAIASTEPGRYRLALMFAPLLTKKDEVLDNKTRYALHGIITERPGIHYTAIKEEFGLSNGAAAYHLDVLEKESFIRSVRDGRLKRFYSAHAKVPDETKRTPEETREAIVGLVRGRPGISQLEVMEELGMDRDDASYYLRELVKESRLEAEKEWRYTVYRVK